MRLNTYPRLLVAAFAATFLVASPARGAMISVNDLRDHADQYAAQGIHVQPNGPDSLSNGAVGMWEVYGSTVPFLDNDGSSRYLAGTATFDQPLSDVKVDVARVNTATLNAGFTIDAFYHGQPVGSETVRLGKLGEWTHVEIAAPDIDEIKWSGPGLVFHPYVIRGFNFKLAQNATQTPTDPPPQVGSAVPEPTSAGFAAVLVAGLLARRRSR